MLLLHLVKPTLNKRKTSIDFLPTSDLKLILDHSRAWLACFFSFTKSPGHNVFEKLLQASSFSSSDLLVNTMLGYFREI